MSKAEDSDLIRGSSITNISKIMFRPNEYLGAKCFKSSPYKSACYLIGYKVPTTTQILWALIFATWHFSLQEYMRLSPWSYSVCVKPQQFVWALVNQRSSPRQNFHCKTHTFCSHAWKKYYKQNGIQMPQTKQDKSRPEGAVSRIGLNDGGIKEMVDVIRV